MNKRSIIVSFLLPLALCGNNVSPARESREKKIERLFTELGIESLAENEPPAYHLATLEGDSVSLAGLCGRFVILHFWATWCKPCREEMPELDTFFRQTKNLPVSILGISIDKPEDSLKVKKAVEIMDLHFPIARAASGKMPDVYWMWGIPVTYLIDQTGKMIGRIRGSPNWTGNKMRELLKLLLNVP